MSTRRRFSIVVPTRNRPESLATCLESLARLDYPADGFEVIVVDDGGTPPVDGVAARFIDRLPLTVLRQPHRGPGSARNAGAQRSTGRWLVFTDDDCQLPPDYLRRLENHVARHPDAMVGGRTVNGNVESLCSTASQQLIDYLYDYSGRTSRLAFFTSNNLVLPAAAFRALGGFDPGWRFAAGEDRDLCDRWRHAGGALVHAPEAVVVHNHLLGLRRFWRQHFNYGRGAYRFHRARARDGRGRHEVEPWGFYTGLLAYPFGHEPTGRALRIATLLLLAQAANALGFFSERRRAAIQEAAGATPG